MNETLFYVLGIGLVVAAVLVAVIGLRCEQVPDLARRCSRRATAAFAALVVATATFAWLNAEDEQEHREAELAEAAEENAAEGDEGRGAEEVGTRRRGASPRRRRASTAPRSSRRPAAAAVTRSPPPARPGRPAPTSTRPSQGEDEAFIETSIVDPNAEVAEGYPPDMMPQTYGDEPQPEELDALVQYLAESTRASAASARGLRARGAATPARAPA